MLLHKTSSQSIGLITKEKLPDPSNRIDRKRRIEYRPLMITELMHWMTGVLVVLNRRSILHQCFCIGCSEFTSSQETIHNENQKCTENGPEQYGMMVPLISLQVTKGHAATGKTAQNYRHCKVAPWSHWKDGKSACEIDCAFQNR